MFDILYSVCYCVTINCNCIEGNIMQAFKTVTTTHTKSVDCIHYTVAHAVLENAQKQIEDTYFETDCTAWRQYTMLANVFSSLVCCFYEHSNSDYISLQEIMHCFEHLTYYDDSCIYDDCVRNTALEKINLLDYVHLSS